ncbi:hypothetical protein [Cryptosporangium aurantiacum]|uniref:Secreted protein n=1 Tax=Cryptosporangium aurantiacum TaxID=134849 RepID=A0A1M7JAA2_9ACTN|nr:hypothetical protein [Cryptosporangium aurantiacum]SHM49932.1 hypothetical protein SAMN05443668_101734 [Cryptosporangium aurantiacum]
MRSSPWSLPVLSVLSLLVIAGSVGWAEATDAQPHAPAAAESEAEPSFEVCAEGDYPAYVLFPETRAKSATAQPGTCVTQTVADAGTAYPIQVYGLDGTTPFLIGDDEVAGEGEQVRATGTTEAPDWVTA